MIAPNFIEVWAQTPEAAKFIPFAKNLCRKRVQYGNFNNWLDIDGFRINARGVNGMCYVRVYGGSPLVRYEFFTSDAATVSADGFYGTPPYQGGLYGSFVCGHSTAVYVGNDIFEPRMMTSWTGLNDALSLDPVHTFQDDAPKWVGRQSYNDQKIAFYQAYSTEKVKGKKVVRYTTTPSAGQPQINHVSVLNGAGGLCYNSYDLGGDIGWDVRNPVYRNSKLVAKIQPLLQPPFWWRRGTVILAKDAAGKTQPITVVTDAMSNFYFFRTDIGEANTVSAEGFSSRYVPPKNFVMIPASSFLPDWVELPTVDTMRKYVIPQLQLNGKTPEQFAEKVNADTEETVLKYQTNAEMPGGDGWAGSERWKIAQECEYLWTFNSDGSAAAAVVHENKGHATYLMRSNDASIYPNGSYKEEEIKIVQFGMVDVWVPKKTEEEKQDYLKLHGGTKNIDLRVRGLVSVNIEVKITGEGVKDFTVSLSVASEVRGRHYIDVEFAMDHPDLIAKGVSENDLLTTELEIFMDGGGSQYEWWLKRYNTLAVRNMRGGEDSEPLLRWRMAAFGPQYQGGGSTAMATHGITDLGIGSLQKVVNQYGNLVPPYNSNWINGAYYDINLFYFRIDAQPLEPYVGAWNGNYDPTAIGWTENTIQASDLKALAFIVGTSGLDDRSERGLHLFMFGEKVASSGNVTDAKLTEMPEVSTMVKLPLCPTREELDAAGRQTSVPYKFWVLYQEAHKLSVGAQGTHLLNVHPAGHYCAYMQDWREGSVMTNDPVIDVINHCATAKDGAVTNRKTTHRDMFNQAFKQARGYGDYQFGAQYGVGMFATAGMWV